MAGIVVAHTGQLDRAALTAARALFDEAFGDEADESDWEHALGGMHALLWDGDVLVAHGALVARRLLHGGRALRAGYVEAVVVRAGARRRGHGGRIMEALEEVALGAYDLAALSATDDGAALYGARGWTRWRGPTSALTPDGVARTPDDDGGVFVMPLGATLDPDGPLTCDCRDGDAW
jgi:aminoglycoside 2'-N-acetyltransferase I